VFRAGTIGTGGFALLAVVTAGVGAGVGLALPAEEFATTGRLGSFSVGGAGVSVGERFSSCFRTRSVGESAGRLPGADASALGGRPGTTGSVRATDGRALSALAATGVLFCNRGSGG